MSRRRDQSGDVAPLLVFALLLLVVTVVVAAIVVARRGGERTDPAAAPAPTAPPADHQLTDTEAIARFKELDALRLRAIEQRRPDLVASAFIRRSPAASRVLKTISKLRRDSVRMEATRYDLSHVDVLSNGPLEIIVRQVVVIATRFVDEAGRDVTTSGATERQTVEWVMQPRQGRWFLYEGTITAAKVVRP